VRDRGRKRGNYWRKQAETGENRAANCRKLSEAVRDIKHRYFDDFGRVFDGSAAILSGIVVAECRGGRNMSAGVGASRFGNFGRFRCRRTKAPLFR